MKGEGPGKQTHHGGPLWHLRDRTGGYREGQATDKMLQASLPDPTGHTENLGLLCETRRGRRLRTWNKHNQMVFSVLGKGWRPSLQRAQHADGISVCSRGDR